MPWICPLTHKQHLAEVMKVANQLMLKRRESPGSSRRAQGALRRPSAQGQGWRGAAGAGDQGVAGRVSRKWGLSPTAARAWVLPATRALRLSARSGVTHQSITDADESANGAFARPVLPPRPSSLSLPLAPPPLAALSEQLTLGGIAPEAEELRVSVD